MLCIVLSLSLLALFKIFSTPYYGLAGGSGSGSGSGSGYKCECKYVFSSLLKWNGLNWPLSLGDGVGPKLPSYMVNCNLTSVQPCNPIIESQPITEVELQPGCIRQVPSVATHAGCVASFSLAVVRTSRCISEPFWLWNVALSWTFFLAQLNFIRLNCSQFSF